MLLKIIVITMILLICYNLFSALYHMMKDDKHDEKMVKNLTWRVALSIGLFLLLMLGIYTGAIVRVSA